MVDASGTPEADNSKDRDPDDRGRGILTKKDRAFLRGDADYGSKSASARRARQRIRDRIRNAVLDFGLICDRLEDRDCKKIFERGASDDRAGFNDGLLGALWFIYSGVEQGQVHAPTGITFSDFIELAVRNAEYDAMPAVMRDFKTVNVDVSVTIDRPNLTDINIEHVSNIVERGEWADLTGGDARTFLRWLVEADALDSDAAVEAVREERERVAETPELKRAGDEFEYLSRGVFSSDDTDDEGVDGE
jgi:hypothetical protein